ncbi:hypothetical protein AVEN_198675-1, partial [Araneus ventricosus]
MPDILRNRVSNLRPTSLGTEILTADFRRSSCTKAGGNRFRIIGFSNVLRLLQLYLVM